MAPTNYISTSRLNYLHCNESASILVGYENTTSVWQDNRMDNYDSFGAMQFIVTTLMVYSLMGISGLLLLRIRRRASRTHRVVSVREEHLQEYIKQADYLKLAGHRHKLKMEASRMVHHLQNLERQRSYNSTNGDSPSVLDHSPFLEQNLQYTDSQKAYHGIPPSFLHDRLVLSPLPEERTATDDQPVHCTENSQSYFSFCKTCEGHCVGSFKQCQSHVTWAAETSQISTCFNNDNTENNDNNMAVEYLLPAYNHYLCNHVRVSDV